MYKCVPLPHLLTGSQGGHVNVSPKGQDSFKVVSRKACWYLDLTGSGRSRKFYATDAPGHNIICLASGNETISHLYEPGNGRLTILFQAFVGPPRILRLFGKG